MKFDTAQKQIKIFDLQSITEANVTRGEEHHCEGVPEFNVHSWLQEKRHAKTYSPKSYPVSTKGTRLAYTLRPLV